MNHTEAIQRLIDRRGCRDYLEIGYGSGENFHALRVVRKLAVDPNLGDRVEVLRQTSDRFFKEAIACGDRFDAIFIDGLHTFDQVLRDYNNALRCLRPSGLILLHDVNPTDPVHVRPMAQYYAEGGFWTGDVYLAWARIRLACPFRTATLPDDFGLGIVYTSTPATPPAFALPAGFDDFRARWVEILGPVDLAGQGDEFPPFFT